MSRPLRVSKPFLYLGLSCNVCRMCPFYIELSYQVIFLCSFPFYVYVYKMCVCVCICASMCVCVCECRYKGAMWRSEDNLSTLRETGSMIAHCCRQPMNSLNAFVPASRLCRCAGVTDARIHIWFHMASGDLSSSPQACSCKHSV